MFVSYGNIGSIGKVSTLSTRSLVHHSNGPTKFKGSLKIGFAIFRGPSLVTQIVDFDFQIEYKPGKENLVTLQSCQNRIIYKFLVGLKGEIAYLSSHYY